MIKQNTNSEAFRQAAATKVPQGSPNQKPQERVRSLAVQLNGEHIAAKHMGVWLIVCPRDSHGLPHTVHIGADCGALV